MKNIYRLISETSSKGFAPNDNSIFEDYEETDIRVKVGGGSSVHTKVLKKNSPKG